ncbi:MAG: hypothetical protein ACRDSZ_03445 [Pseudonocardiaceae bacterium]
MAAAGAVPNLTDRVWLRSREEERGSVRVYRPEDYPFPPARGRDGLVFHADGGFDYLGPGRGDRPGKDTGTWRPDPNDSSRITANVADQTIELRILEVTDDVLHLEWLLR